MKHNKEFKLTYEQRGTESRLQIGDVVFAKAFTDCYGKFHPQTDLLTVISVQYIDNEVAPHWRAKAIGANGFQWEEGNQDHFGLYTELKPARS